MGVEGARKLADADLWGTIADTGMDKVAVTQMKPHMDDPLLAEKEEIARLVGVVNLPQKGRFGLEVGITGEGDPHLFKEGLNEARAIKPKGGPPSPGVRKPKKLFAEDEDFWKGAWAAVEAEIALLYPSGAAIDELDGDPTGKFLIEGGDDFEWGAKREAEQWSIGAGVGDAVEMGRLAPRCTDRGAFPVAVGVNQRIS